eukprot:3674258-Prymnesium_polylepis.3
MLLADALCASGRRELSLGQQGCVTLLLCLPDAFVMPGAKPAPLEILSLGAFRIDAEAVKKLAPCVSKSATLRELRLSTPVAMEVEEALVLGASCVTRERPFCLLGNVPADAHESLRDADA